MIFVWSSVCFASPQKIKQTPAPAKPRTGAFEFVKRRGVRRPSAAFVRTSRRRVIESTLARNTTVPINCGASFPVRWESARAGWAHSTTLRAGCRPVRTRAIVWSAVTSAPLSSGRVYSMIRGRLQNHPCVNRRSSIVNLQKRFARFGGPFGAALRRTIRRNIRRLGQPLSNACG
jgi:hypothetical protein